MNAKTKKIVTIVVIVALLAVLAVTWFKNRKEATDPSEGTQGFSVETLTKGAPEESSELKTETQKESEKETQSIAESETQKATETEPETSTEPATSAASKIDKNGKYSDKESVALYLHTYGKLPSNYLTKSEAEAKGWSSSKGNLWKVANGMSIGGDSFGNFEGKLPKKSGRKYYECDIDYKGGYRNEKRIIYSNDGLVFYTDDHYETFEQLY